MPVIKKEVEVDVDILVRCYECGGDIMIKHESVDVHGDVIISVESCDCKVKEKGDE